MAVVFNPWQASDPDPVAPGGIASFAINGKETPGAEMEHEIPEHESAMSQALKVIAQQSDVISRLLADLRVPK